MAELQSVGWRPPMLKAHNVQIIDHRQIAELATRARAVPRKRAHLLLHEGPADPVQRLIILLQPSTYVRPHHHSRQWEMLVLQQGRGNLLIFDGDARLMDRIELNPRSSVVQIPIGVWHGFVVLERNTAVLEIKPGPYVPNEFADWAPEEGDATATRFVKWITNAAPGERWSLTQRAVRANRVVRDEVE
jgi:cupin fold WbuC family metalloprotein